MSVKILPPGGRCPKGADEEWRKGTYGSAMERNQKLTHLSQSLRKNQTKEEALLWYNFLRKYPLPFRRQYVIGDYIVDFYCHKAKLVVELDGAQHYEIAYTQKDTIRTRYLNEQGLFVLRFSNRDVLRDFNGVCEKIELSIKERIGKQE